MGRWWKGRKGATGARPFCGPNVETNRLQRLTIDILRIRKRKFATTYVLYTSQTIIAKLRRSDTEEKKNRTRRRKTNKTTRGITRHRGRGSRRGSGKNNGKEIQLIAATHGKYVRTKLDQFDSLLQTKVLLLLLLPSILVQSIHSYQRQLVPSFVKPWHLLPLDRHFPYPTLRRPLHLG